MFVNCFIVVNCTAHTIWRKKTTNFEYDQKCLCQSNPQIVALRFSNA